MGTLGVNLFKPMVGIKKKMYLRNSSPDFCLILMIGPHLPCWRTSVEAPMAAGVHTLTACHFVAPAVGFYPPGNSDD